MYHVSAQGVDERMITVLYYYYNSHKVKSAITKMFSHDMRSLFQSAFTRNDRKSHHTHCARLQSYDCSDEVSKQRK